jgi:opacity protein-like surface antigen
MKKFLLGLIGAIAVAAPVAAADPPARAYTKAPAYIDPASHWTGFYVGLNAGGAWGHSDATTTTVFSPTGFFDRHRRRSTHQQFRLHRWPDGWLQLAGQQCRVRS